MMHNYLRFRESDNKLVTMRVREYITAALK